MKSHPKTKKTRSNVLQSSPANNNGPLGSKFENSPQNSEASHVYQRKHGVTVYSNLPEILPILDFELNLVHKFFGEFVNSILANDNETEQLGLGE